LAPVKAKNVPPRFIRRDVLVLEEPLHRAP
jgi:hypothetical protein